MMASRSSRVGLLAGLMLLVLLLAACQAPEDQTEAGDTDGDTGTETADGEPDTDVEVGDDAADGDESAGGGSLTVAIPADIAGWDQDFVAFDEVALAMFKNTYPYMLDYGVTEIEGEEVLDTENIEPLYAESWEPNDDFTEWTLTIQEGLRFPSGNEVTAHDVKWSKDRAFAAQANVAGIYQLIGLTEPDQVEVVDDYTVRFTQEWPSALTDQIQAISMYVFDSEMVQEHATEDDEWATEWMQGNPVDGGPFNVESHVPGEEIVLRANPDFAGEPPAVDEIRLEIIPSASTRRLQLESGDIDIALGLSRQDIEDLRDAEGIHVVSSPSNEYVSMPMNVTMEPFNDPTVRQALAHAIPYDQIIDDVYMGDARRSTSIVPLDIPGHVDTWYPYDHDPGRAEELLAEAGYADGFATDLIIEADNEEHERLAVLVQGALSDVGVDVSIETLDPGTLAERRGQQDIPFQITEGQLWVDDVEYLLATSLVEGAFLNYANYTDERIAEIFSELNTTVDEDERMALAAEAQDILAEDVPWLMLGQPNYNLPMRDHVDGWVQPVDGLFRLRYLETTS